MGGIIACCKMGWELPGCLIFPHPDDVNVNKQIKTKIAKLTNELINFIQFKFLLKKYYVRPGFNVAFQFKNEENLMLSIIWIWFANVKCDVIQMDINFLVWVLMVSNRNRIRKSLFEIKPWISIIRILIISIVWKCPGVSKCRAMRFTLKL